MDLTAEVWICWDSCLLLLALCGFSLHTVLSLVKHISQLFLVCLLPVHLCILLAAPRSYLRSVCTQPSSIYVCHSHIFSLEYGWLESASQHSGL